MGDSRKWAYEELLKAQSESEKMNEESCPSCGWVKSKCICTAIRGLRWRTSKELKPPTFEDDTYMTISKFADEPLDDRPDQHAHGAKLDQGKIDITLLQEFSRALHEVARVGDYGQHKYTRGGFLGVVDGVRRYTRAMLDHWFKEETEGTYDQDSWYDTEVGKRWKGMIRHDAQVAWNALARLEIKLREEENG